MRKYIPVALRRSLIRKAAVVILVVTLVLGVFGLFTIQEVSSEVTEQRDTELLTSTEQEAASLEEWISRQRSATTYLSQDNKIQTAEQGERSEVLQNRISRLTSTAVSVHYVDLSSDQILSSTDESVEGASYSSFSIPWRGEGLNFYGGGDAIMSSVFEYQGQSVVAFASKQPDTENAIFGSGESLDSSGTNRQNLGSEAGKSD
ncbi:hypothetical protein [Halovenus salina]